MMITVRKVPPELHKQARVAAIMQGISLNQLMLKALENYVSHNAQSGASPRGGRGTVQG